MATRPRLDPGLTAAVNRAREQLASAGEVRLRGGGFESRIPAEIGAVIGELLRNGTYAEAVARVTADDPDLSDE